MKPIDFRPYILIVSSILSALTYIFLSIYVSYAIIILVIFVLFRIKYASILFVVYSIFFFYSPHVFIITDVEHLEQNQIKLKTPTASIIMSELKDNIEIGSIIVSNFNKINDKPFSKQRYEFADSNSYASYDLKIITDLLQFRERTSEKMFYLSGGKVTVTQALIFSNKKFIDNDTSDLYIVTGLAHLLAMSGLHVGIIILLVVLLLPKTKKRFRYIVTIPVVLMLIVMGGFSITVIRASLMAIIYITITLLNIDINPKKFILVIFSTFVIASPLSITNVSFLLSFGAIIGIVFLLNNNKGIISKSLMIGIAATLITAPLSLFYFGTTNHLSIISTIIMVPIIQVQIIFGFIASIFPEIAMPTLILVESISKIILMTISQYTYFAFTLKFIPMEALIPTIVFVIVTLMSQYKYLSLLSLLIIFYPTVKPPEFIFPNFKGATKGFLSYKDNKGEIIYFSGTINQFKYYFLPIIAKYGINSFKYGSVNIINSRKNSRYIKIENETKDYDDVCLNYIYNNCKIVYHTKANSIKKNFLDDGKIHIIYKNNYKFDNVFILDDIGQVIIDNGVIGFDNNQSK